MEPFSRTRDRFHPGNIPRCEIVEHERIVAENARLKKEMDEAAEYINGYLQEIPTCYKPHNWLIRNGYKDESYQESIYGQEIYEP